MNARNRPKTLYLALLAIVLLAACDSGEQAPAPDTLPTRFVVTVAADDATARAGTPIVPPTIVTLPSQPPDVVAVAVTLPPSPGGPAALPASFTPTVTPSATPTITVTPSATITDTPTATASATPTQTLEPNPLLYLAELAAQATVLPQNFAPPPAVASPTVTPAPGAPPGPPTLACQFPAPGGFAAVLAADPSLVGRMGCPVGAPPAADVRSAAVQAFERGTMIWLSDTPGSIYVLFDDGRYQRFDDTFTPGIDAESAGLVPPAGLQEPVRGFGKVWREVLGLRDGLGWALAGESGDTATALSFTRGRMVALASRDDVLVLIQGTDPGVGAWLAYPGGF